MPISVEFLQGALAPFLTNLIKSFGFGGADSILIMNFFRVAKIWNNTLLCVKVKQPSLRATLHAPKMCAVVQMVLLHRKQEASEEILHDLSGYLVMVKYQKLKRQLDFSRFQ